jgi:hypothetical protein
MNLTPTTPVATPPIIAPPGADPWDSLPKRVREGVIDLSEYINQEEDDDE